ncbi:EpsG family protein [Bacteroides heparinolyticus]|uniref:Polysaccharide polymerase n=1 Tax=Prevotella heparinolytica TaxID=28113 RepID=A0A449I7S9_9BACE|nr:EpsG family protein [Bacteroides heparinolyticus]MCI6213148.1 EpsG family protein [Bacteroides heparinolyticus]VFB15474.1 polysaccharide polymerase [Bacteroides heparinolyticus]
MIYILSLLLCLFLAWNYDIIGRKRNKLRWYRILLCWFILVSAFQYMVGSDMELYVEKYESFPTELSVNTIKTLMDNRQQPGWVLISWICRIITGNFFLMQLIHAVVLNVAVFTFFRRESKYIFLCVLFYAISAYLVLNFNAIRQSYSIAFGLYAFSALRREQWKKYFLFVFAAFMFHNTAILLLVFPLFRFLRFSGKTLLYFIAVVVLFIVILFRIDFETLMISVIETGVLGDSLSDVATSYIADEDLGVEGRYAQLSFHLILVILVVFYYIIKKKNLLYGGAAVSYMIMVILTGLMPILWRFRLFFDFEYFVILAQVVIESPPNRYKKYKKWIYLAAILVFFYFPFRDYMRPYVGSKFRYIDQYYPYHSIFYPVKEQRSL